MINYAKEDEPTFESPEIAYVEYSAVIEQLSSIVKHISNYIHFLNNMKRGLPENFSEEGQEEAMDIWFANEIIGDLKNALEKLPNEGPRVDNNLHH